MNDIVTPDETRDYYLAHPRARTLALVVVCLGSALNPLMLSSVSIAIPAIAADLSATADEVSWLPTSFMLATAVLLVPFGRLSDMFGRKRIYLAGLASMVVGGTLAGSAGSMEMLLFGRVVQGGASAMIFGTGMAILTAIYPPNRLGFALGTAASCVYIGLTAGPWFGGIVTDWLGWRMVFHLQVPVYVTVIVMTLAFLKGEWRVPERTRFDAPGALLYALWMVMIVVGMTELPSPQGALTFALGIVTLAWFLKDQSNKAHPLVRVQAVRANHVFSYSLIASLFTYAATFPMLFLMSLYLQYVGGLAPRTAGLVLLVQALTTAIAVPFAGRAADLFQPRNIATTGCTLVGLGSLWLLQLDFGTPVHVVVVGQVLMGLGLACFGTPNSSAAMRSLTTGNLGMASALVNLARTLGNMLGMGLVMLAIAFFIGPEEMTPEHYPGLVSTVHVSLGLSAMFSIVAAYFSWSRGTLTRHGD